MRAYKYLFIVCSSVALLGSITSCKKQLEEESYSFISPNNFYKNESDAKTAEFDQFLDEDKLLEFWQDIKARHPRMKGIFFTNSRAFRIVKFFSPEDSRRYDVVGFDMIDPNIQFLKEDMIDFIINQNPILHGYMGIMNFVNHFVLKKEVKKIQYLPLDIVIKENVDFYIDNFRNHTVAKG